MEDEWMEGNNKEQKGKGMDEWMDGLTVRQADILIFIYPG